MLVSHGARGNGDVRLALIDYGQVKMLSRAQRLQLARVIVALDRSRDGSPQNKRRVAELVGEMGLVTKKNDPEVLYSLAQLFFDRDDPLVTRGLNTHAYIEALADADATVSMCDDFFLVARASLMLRGLGHLLNQHRSVAALWAPIAERVLREAGEDPDAVMLRGGAVTAQALK